MKYAMIVGDGMADLTRFNLLTIMAYHWPGNVRGVEKLADALKWRATLQGQGSAFIPRHLGVLNWQHDLSTIHGRKPLQKSLAKFICQAFLLNKYDNRAKSFSKTPKSMKSSLATGAK